MLNNEILQYAYYLYSRFTIINDYGTFSYDSFVKSINKTNKDLIDIDFTKYYKQAERILRKQKLKKIL